MVTLNAANEKFNAAFGLLCPIFGFYGVVVRLLIFLCCTS
jgi:hypothetical protein